MVSVTYGTQSTNKKAFVLVFWFLVCYGFLKTFGFSLTFNHISHILIKSANKKDITQ